MPRLPRYSNWDVLSRAYLPKDIKPPSARSIRFGRPLPRLRFKLGSHAFAIRPIVPIAISLATLHAAVHTGYLFPSGSQTDPAIRHAFELGTTLLIFSACLIASFKYVDPTLVAFSRIRTAEVRRAIAMHRRGVFDSELAAQLAQQLTARTRQLAFKREHGLLAPGGIHVIWQMQPHRLILIIAIFLPQLTGDYGKAIGWLRMPFLLSPMLGLVALYLHGSLLPARLARTAAHRQCPDCNYPLANLPSPFAGAPGQPIPSGPERCPECGSPWPLVPPRLH